MYFYYNIPLNFFFFLNETWVRALSYRTRWRWVRENPYIEWPSTLFSCGQPKRGCCERSGGYAITRRPLQGRGLWPCFHYSDRVPGASSTGSAWYESKREVGSGLFSFHTESEQNNCLRKTYCIFLSYLIFFPASIISKLSEPSDVWQKTILQNLCRYLT